MAVLLIVLGLIGVVTVRAEGAHCGEGKKIPGTPIYMQI